MELSQVIQFYRKKKSSFLPWQFLESVDLDVLISCILLALDIHNWWIWYIFN